MVSYEDVISFLPLPLAIVDGSGSILDVNQKFELLVNNSRKYLTGLDLCAVLFKRESDVHLLKNWIKKSYVADTEVINLDVGPFRFFISPVYTGDKKWLAVLVAKRHTEVQVNFVDFLRGIFHEIRNPLTGIKGSVQVLGKKGTVDRELLDVLISEVERIERFMHGLIRSLSFSDISYQVVNLHRLIDDVLLLMDAQFERNGVEVIRMFDPSLPMVRIDRDRLMQAFINVVKNSVEAMCDTGRKVLTVKTGYSTNFRNFVEVEFVDTGEGIDMDDLEKVFAPFFSLKGGGTGLGLYITKEIVESHGGRVDISSRKGVGTSVVISIPIKR